MEYSRLIVKLGIFLLIFFSTFQLVSAASYVVHNTDTVEEFTTIQAAIDDSDTIAGHTLTVDDVGLSENVVVNKSVNIVGAGVGLTIVTASDANDHVFNVTANGVNISGLTATGATSKAGIYLSNSNYSKVENVNASGNAYGIYLSSSSNNIIEDTNASVNTQDGIYLTDSNYTTIANNTANLNGETGIHLESSSNSTIANNTAWDNTDNGIYLDSSSNNTIANNTANSNDYAGIYLSSSSTYNTLDDNTANSNDKGILLSNSNNNTIVNNNASSNTGCGIWLYANNNYNTLSNNTATSNGYGISLQTYCNYNTVEDNTLSSNGYGIYLEDSNYTTVANNTANSNTDYGISLSSSSHNTVYNNYFNNTNNTGFTGTNANNWNTTQQAVTNVIGGSNIGGNFWAYPNGTGHSQTCTDSGNDGICDSSYTLNGSENADYLPLAAGNVNNINTGEQFLTIQSAIDDADTASGHTINIAAGTYTENVDVTKAVNIVGAGAGVTIVNASVASDHVFNVTANGVNISGLTATGATGVVKAGIYLSNSNYSKVENVNASGNAYGVYFSYSNHGIIANNTASSNTQRGIYLLGASYNTIANNTANSNTQYGIAVSTSLYNNLMNNNASLNGDGISIDGDNVNNVISGGTISNNAQYAVSSYAPSNSTVTGVVMRDNTLGGISLSTQGDLTDNNTFSYNNISGGTIGISLNGILNSTIQGNNIENASTYGISLSSSSNNALSNNNASSNTLDGIHLDSSNNNTISNNVVSDSDSGYGINLSSSNYTTIEDNTVSSNNAGGIFLNASSSYNTMSNNTVSSNIDGIKLDSSSSYNTMSNNTVSGSWYGIHISSSSNNTIEDSNISSNIDGIVLTSSSNNTIANNTVSSSNDYGISLSSSGNNNIYNNYFNNTVNFLFSGTNTNDWNTTLQSGTSINGGPNLGGNFWAYPNGTGYSQTCSDINDDGICDSPPYTLNGSENADYLPLAAGDVTNVDTGEQFLAIQAAIDDADTAPGHTINIAAGTYTENVDVTKAVNIVGAGAGVTIVTASDVNDHVFNVTANSVNISGLTATGATGEEKAGIYLSNSNYSKVENVNASGNYDGVYLNGAGGNTFTDNTINSNAGCGIRIEWGSNNNTVSGNAANSNDGCGIYITDSNYNTIANNTIESNGEVGMTIDSSSSGNTIYNNFFNDSVYLDETPNNDWNTTLQSGTSINGGPNIGGNFWAYQNGAGYSYTCSDTNNDGICDTSYTIASGNVDYLPLAAGNVNNTDTGERFYTIQAAIDDADTAPGHTINISAGTYTENVDVTKAVNIVGAGAGVTIVTASDVNDHVFNVTASGVNISGLSVTGVNTSKNLAGVYLSNSNYSKIENVNVSNNGGGIYLEASNNNVLTNNNITESQFTGLNLSASSNNQISGGKVTSNSGSYNVYINSNSQSNTISGVNLSSNNSVGVAVYGSSNNTAISGCTINDHSTKGIHIFDSNNATITGCNIHNNTQSGIFDPPKVASSYHTFINNNISGSSVGMQLESLSGSTITGNTVWNCTNYGILNYNSGGGNTFSSNTLYNNTYGYYFQTASGDTISGGTVTNSTSSGIYLTGSSANTITGVTVTHNNQDLSGGGVYLTGSSNGNTLSSNTISNNPFYGVNIEGSSGNTLTSNQIVYNCGGEAGINLFSGNDTVIIYNNISNGTGAGINWRDSSNVTVSGNTFDSNALLGIYQYDSSAPSMNSKVFNNTFTRSTVAQDAIVMESASNFAVSNNRISYFANAILLTSTADNNKIVANTLQNNTCGVNSSTNGKNNTIMFNIISGNTFGVSNTNASFNLKAQNNYWGAANGPSGAGIGSGDNVSVNVTYVPYLNVSTSGGSVTTTTGLTGTIDLIEVAKVEVEYNVSAPVDVTVTKYDTNPGTTASFASDIGYIDVYVPDASALNGLTVKYYYTAAEVAGTDESSLKMSYYNASSSTYIQCSNTGANTTDTGDYSGYVWAIVNTTTTPTINELTGTVFGIGGSITPVATTGGGRSNTLPSYDPLPQISSLTSSLFQKIIDFFGAIKYAQSYDLSPVRGGDSLALASTLISTGEYPDVSGFDVTVGKPVGRMSGNIYRLSSEKALARFAHADKVVVARGDLSVDSLAAIAYAKAQNMPILLTEPDELPEDTLAAIKKLGPSKVLIAGGPKAVFEVVETELEGLAAVERKYGKTRYETAVELARTIEGPDVIVITSGENPEVDAVITSAAYKAPLLYVGEDVPAVVKSYLKENPDAKIVYGSGVSDDVKDIIKNIVG